VTDRRSFVDGDTRAVRRASRMVGLQITVAFAAVVLAIVLGVFVFVDSRVKPSELFEAVPDNADLDVSAEIVLRVAILLGLALIVIAGVLSWFVTRRAVKPLGEALRIQRNFVADASHELRTPLTVLDARLQLLQRSLPAGDPSVSIVEDLRGDTRSLIVVVNDLLESVEAAGSRPSGSPAAVPLGPVVRLAVESMRVLGAERGVEIEFSHPDEVETFLPAASANRCMVALLDNALRFSPDGSTIRVELAVVKGMARVSVRDHGPGIRGIDPSRVFDRFAHAGPAVDGGGSTRTGFGIGLSLVRDIVVRNGGSVSVVDSSENGTEIAFSVPVAHTRL